MLMLLISACGKTGALYLPDVEKDADKVKTSTVNPVINNQEIDRGSL